MKTTFIFLACLLVITAGSINPNTEYWVNKEKQCNNKAEEISSQDCKQQCDGAKFGDDCVECIGKHKDYDYDCKDIMLSLRCHNYYVRYLLEDCKEECGFDSDTCKPCIRPLLDQHGGLICRISMHFDTNPSPGQI